MILRNQTHVLALLPEEFRETAMSNYQQRGSAAPMWWGITLVLAFTVAATLRFHLIDGPAKAAAQELQQPAHFAEQQK